MLTDLAVTPIAQTLRTLSAERRSGDFQVRSGQITKTVFFDRGRIVFAASNMKRDRLGEALVAVGRITDEEYTRASALMRGDRRRRLGEALVQAGVLAKNEVGRSVARQVKRIIVSLFEFTEGVGAFEERKCVIPLEYMVSVSVHRILYMGIKVMKSRELVLAGLGNLDRWVTLASVPPFPFGIRKCSAEELEVLEHSKRRVTLRRLAWSNGELAFSKLRTVYSLLASGVLEEADRIEGQSAAPEPIIQMETSTFLLSALQGRPDPSHLEAIRQEVDGELGRSARLDRETWLKVSRVAPRDELVRALEDKMERYHALLEAVGEDRELRTDIELILGRASTMLRLARQAPAGPPPPPPATAQTEGALRAPLPNTVPVPPIALPPPPTESPARVGASTLIRPPVIPPPVAAGTAPLPAAHAPSWAVTSAEALPTSASPSSAGVPSASAASMPPPAPAPVPATAPAPPSPPAPAGSPAEAQTIEPLRRDGQLGDVSARLEHLLMEAHVRMTVSDYGNAVKVYAAIVDLAPKVAAYRARLAFAMACWPRTAKQAEREFLEAVRLEPDNADLHFQFGIYYKAMKVRSRAISEMRTAVKLNPRHKQAREELEALSPKDSALTSLRNLFKQR